MLPDDFDWAVRAHVDRTFADTGRAPALGVPAILGTDGWTRTVCAHSREPLEFGVRDGRLRGDPAVIHLVTPLRDAWVDIGFT